MILENGIYDGKMIIIFYKELAYINYKAGGTSILG